MEINIKMKFDRNVIVGKDYISPGSYTIITKDGEHKQFDFCEVAMSVYSDKTAEFNCSQIDEEYSDPICIEDIENMKEFEEFFVGIGNESNDITLESIEKVSFEGPTKLESWKKVELSPELLKSANDKLEVDYNI